MGTENANNGIEKLTVSSSILEKMIGVSERRIRQLVEEGILVRVTKGKYDLVKSIKNYIQYLRLSNEIDKPEEDTKLNYDDEHAKNERVKRMQNELKLQLMRGEVHSASQVEIVVADMLTEFRNRILLIPEKLTPMLVDQNETAYVKRTLEREVHEALNQLKDYNPSDYYDDSYIELFQADEGDSDG